MSNENRPTYLSRKARSKARVWTEFIKKYRDNPKHLHCFFEGTDDKKYYRPRINSIVFNNATQLTNTCTYWCDGKENVIELHRVVVRDSRFKNAWVSFFVDNDFDNKDSVVDTLYVTPAYSIENLYVTKQTFEQILLDEFNIDRHDEEFDDAVILFDSLLCDFLDLIDYPIAWIYLQRQHEKNSTVNSKLNLRSLKLNQWIAVSVTNVRLLYDFADFKAHFPDAAEFETEQVEAQVALFRSQDRSKVYRGKFLLYFFQKFLEHLATDRRTKNGKRKHFQSKGSVGMMVTDNILSELTQYAQTPSCLHEFLTALASKRNVQMELISPKAYKPPNMAST